MMPRVQSVSRSPKHGFSKEPQLFVRLIAGEGVEGDAHRGVTTQHLYLKRKDASLPNLAQVHLIAGELLEELASRGHTVRPGELGENVLTAGIDLLALPRGTKLMLGDQAMVEVTGLRTPCSQIDAFQPGLQQHMWGERDAEGKRTRRAGVMSIVLVGGEVRPGDPIHIERPLPPHVPLGPV